MTVPAILAFFAVFSVITGLLYYQVIKPTSDLTTQSQPDNFAPKTEVSETIQNLRSPIVTPPVVPVRPTAPAPSSSSNALNKILSVSKESYLNLGAGSTSGDLKSLAPGAAMFSDVFYTIINSNRVFSPVSIVASLSILRESASGETRTQIDKALRDLYYCNGKLTTLSRNYVTNMTEVGQLTAYLAVNSQIPLNNSFIQRMRPFITIKADNFNDSMNTNLAINRHFVARTEGALNNAAKLIKYDSKGILYDFFYFKAEWLTPFDPKISIAMNFTQNVGTKRVFRAIINVLPVAYYGDNQIQLLELDFKGKQYSMGFLLPALDKNKKSIPAIFNSSFLYSTLPKLKLTENVKIVLPKFRLKRVLRMMGWLKRLGINDLFDVRRASFPLLAPKGGFALTEIIHEGMVGIDELGSNSHKHWWKQYQQSQQLAKPKKNETSILAMKANKEFIADRNFLFYIRHKASNLLLFVGDFDG